MHGTRLESVVDARVPRLRRLRRRLVFATGFLIGAGAVTALVLAARGSPPAVVVVPVPQPMPLAVAIAAEPPPPPPPAPAPTPAADDLGCPEPIAPDADEPAIGRALAVERLPEQVDDPDPLRELRVRTAANAPTIAIRRWDSTVWISDDDGATFRQAFADRDVEDVAVADDGTVYAIAPPALGVRAADTHKVRWRDAAHAACPKDVCADQVAVLGDRVVWFHDEVIATSANHGRSWSIVDRDSEWQVYDDDTDVFTWDGEVYGVRHYTDMCGVDDTPVSHFDGDHAEYDVFHNYVTIGEAVLAADDPVGTRWRWRERCWHEPDQLGSCGPNEPEVPAALIAATLRPRAGGGRVLAPYRGSLIELCPEGARQIYREFPYGRVAATDWRGRPVVVAGDTVVRWSPVHGWRRLYQVPEPESAGAPFALE